MEPMLTPKDVAVHLKIHVDEVRRLLKSGELEGINIGQGDIKPRWRIDHESLERFKRRLTVHPQETAARTRARPKDYQEIL